PIYVTALSRVWAHSEQEPREPSGLRLYRVWTHRQRGYERGKEHPRQCSTGPGWPCGEGMSDGWRRCRARSSRRTANPCSDPSGLAGIPRLQAGEDVNLRPFDSATPPAPTGWNEACAGSGETKVWETWRTEARGSIPLRTTASSH